jgi:histone deacetylase complex regulatory component SIN3
MERVAISTHGYPFLIQSFNTILTVEYPIEVDSD